MARLRDIILTLLLIAAPGVAVAQSPDPHQIYEEHCTRCHAGHAGDFAWESLEQREGEVVTRRSGRPLTAFLRTGHGRLPPEQVAALSDHLAAILGREALFQRKCRACHARALPLARLKLILRNGRLTGRYTDRDIAAFLSYHGRLTAGEVPVLVEMLTGQLQTAGR